jgi:quinol monooxygenase YgiN
MKSCTIIGMVVAKDGTREELREILAAQVAPTRAEPGCVNFDFSVDAEHPNVFMFYENWRCKKDLDAHLKAPPSSRCSAVSTNGSRGPWRSSSMRC